jgi:hypothetical protein
VSHTHPATGLGIDDWLRDIRLTRTSSAAAWCSNPAMP